MEEFVMRLRSLHNIGGYCLPEFDDENRRRFCREPVHYMLACDDEHRAVIWRELEKRHARSMEIRASWVRA